MNFVPLHVYSGYSILKGGVKFDELFKTAKKLGYSTLGLTDLNSLVGAPHFVSLCKENGIKPVLGEDIIIDGYTLTFIILSEEGYKNLLAISLLSQKRELTLKYIQENNAGLAIILSSNEIENEIDLAKKIAKLSRGIINFYIGLNHLGKNVEQIREFSYSHGYSLLAFPFVKYVTSEDAIILKMLNSIETKEILSQKKFAGDEYLLSFDEVKKYYKDEEIDLTEKLANEIDFSLLNKRGKMLHYVNKDNLSSNDYLKKIAHKNLIKLNLNLEQYNKRLNEELDVITSMGYSDYFLIVKDYVDFAKANNIAVGPGRGSAVGSLVSYVLGITQVDPLKYNLIFERFLNKDRQTLPDIDIDFSDIYREDVVNYIKRKYGSDRVAKIIAVQKFGAKQSLRDVGAIFGYEKRDIELFTKLIRKDDEKSSLRDLYKTNVDFRNLVNEDKYYLEIVSLAKKLEGLPRQYGLHAAGIVINNDPLKDVIPLMIDDTNTLIEQFEKDYLEDQYFLKMDILSLRNLTIVDDCIARIKENTGITLNRDKLPVDDIKALEQIKSTKTMGLFQIESYGMRQAIKIIKPSSLEDVVALISIHRPGPLDKEKEYADHKFGKTKITYPSKALEEILSPTYGILIYQEQVMQIANKMAGFTYAEADLLRRAIAKKDSKKLASYQKKFINGALANSYTQKEADNVYKLIYKFGDYGFNRSHALGYAYLTCRMAYLKAHYPKEFYASILSNSNSENFSNTITEIKSAKIKVLNPDINLSQSDYITKGDSIIFPLTSVRGIMNITTNAILEERKIKPFEDFFDFVVRMAKYKVNSKQILSLIDAGAFDNLEPSRASLRNNIPAALNYASMIGDSNGEMIIDITMFPKPTLQKVKDDVLYNLNKEFDALGLMISGSPLNEIKKKCKNIKLTNIADIDYSKGNINIACIFRNIKTIRTKKGKAMAYATIYDDSGEIEITIFPEAYITSSKALTKNTIVIVEGYFNSYKDEFVVKQISKPEELANG